MVLYQYLPETSPHAKGVGVGAGVDVFVGVAVAVLVGDDVAVCVGVEVGVAVSVLVGVLDGVGVAGGVTLLVGDGVTKLSLLIAGRYKASCAGVPGCSKATGELDSAVLTVLSAPTNQSAKVAMKRSGKRTESFLKTGTPAQFSGGSGYDNS